VRRFLVGLLATVGFLTLLVGIVGAAAVAWFMRQEGPTLPEQILLVADLREELPEALPTRGIASLGLDGGKLTLSDVTLALEQAAGDPRVRGLIAHVDDTSHGFAVAQELRQAVERFRAGGRFAVAHADTFGELTPGNEGYYLAAAFDRIELQPAGLLGLTGIAAELPFVGKLLNDLGVRLEVEKRAEYKTVLENFSEAQISPANREMLEGIVGELAGQLSDGIAAGRQLPREDAVRLMGAGPYTAVEAQTARLIDEVRHFDEALSAARAQAGPEARTVSLEDYWEARPPGREAAARVAFVRGTGMIRRGEGGLGSGIAAEDLAGTLAEAVDDDEVEAILLRLDTGGGSAVASETIARQLRRAVAAGKPVVVSMGNTAASGGYWIAVEGTTLLAQPATLTGSIGVVAAKPVLTGLWERFGVTWAQVARGENAAMWSVNEPYTPAARARLVSLIDAIYGDFKANVARGRDLDPARVEEIARGRVWTGREAAERGLVDRLGGLHEALAAVREALELAPDAPLALEPRPRPRPAWARLMRLMDEGFGGLETLAALPRAFLGSGTLALTAPVSLR
jgi:protease-4